MRVLFLAATVMLLFGISAADEILLKNGNVINGEIVYSDDKVIKVKVPFTDETSGKTSFVEMKFNRSQVKRGTRTGGLFNPTRYISAPEEEKDDYGPTAAVKRSSHKGRSRSRVKRPAGFFIEQEKNPKILDSWMGTTDERKELQEYLAYVNDQIEKIPGEKDALVNQLKGLPQTERDTGVDKSKVDLDSKGDPQDLNILLNYLLVKEVPDTLQNSVKDLKKRQLFLYRWKEKFEEKLKETPLDRGEAGGSVNWLGSYEAALGAAAVSGKKALLFFNKGEKNEMSVKYENEIINSPEFGKWAASKFVFYKADSSTKDKTLKNQISQLKRQLKVVATPIVVFVNADGTEVGRIGYLFGGPQAWIKSADKICSSKGGRY